MEPLDPFFEQWQADCGFQARFIVTCHECWWSMDFTQWVDPFDPHPGWDAVRKWHEWFRDTEGIEEGDCLDPEFWWVIVGEVFVRDAAHSDQYPHGLR